MSPPTNCANVAHGAALLDRYQPGWYRQIDLARLDARTDDDVPGQLHDDSHQGLTELLQADPDPQAQERRYTWAIEHGFEPVWNSGPDPYAKLTACWYAEIVGRLDVEGGR